MIDSSVGGQPAERSATEGVAKRSGHGPAGGPPPVPEPRPVVAIVGAGIAGLVVAHRLAAMGVPIAIVDAAPRPGGRIATRRQDGLVLEAGPDGFLAGPAVLGLCRELGLEEELVEPLPPATTSILWRGRLHPLPPGTAAGVPVALRAFWPTALLRSWEKARVLLDLVLPGEGDALALDDPLGPALRRRLGRAVVERLVEPLLGGLHGGGLDDLSGGAVAPWLVDVLRQGSLVRGLRRRQGAGPMRLLSLHGGMERLVEGLARDLKDRAGWYLGRGAEGVARGPEGWRVVLEDGSALEAAGLVLACPAPAAGRLLEGVDGELARLLGTIAYGSLGVVNLAYREADLGRAPEGHGFLVPRVEPGRLRGVSWASRKWPGRAPAGVLLARAFLDLEPGSEPASQAIAEEAVAGLEPILAPRRLPFVVEIHRFARAMPRYTVGHLGRVAAIEARRRRLPGLFLVGSAYRGAGIGELVAAAEAVAREVGAALGAGARASN